MTQAIQPYYGELLISPIPLEMSLIEPCDYGCAYCFAVLGDRHHAAKTGESVHSNGVKQALSLIQNASKRSTLAAQLIKDRYPVLISNRTDPFGRVNRSSTMPILEVMAEMGIPVAIQTKGFVRADDRSHILETLPPSCWYISIAFDDDAMRTKVEPGAPTIKHRLDLIAELIAKGHGVVVGLNPCVPEFLPDPRPLLTELKALGVWGVWVECLHLNHWQEKQMTLREKNALGQPLIDRVKKKGTQPKDFAHFELTRSIAQELGLEVYSMGQPNRSNFWNVYEVFYPKHFPILQDLVNACHDTLADGTLISFSDFLDFMSPDLPSGILQTGHYIGSTAHQVCREMGKEWTNKMSYDRLLAMLWCEPRIKMSPANACNFSYAVQGEQMVLNEADGLPLMVWNSAGHSALYVEV